MKNFVLFCLVSLFVISCTSNQNRSAINETLVTEYFKLFNEHKWEELSNLYVENAEFKDPSMGKGVVKQTREQFIEKYSELNGIFPDISDEVIQLYPSGDNHIIVEFISRGTAPDDSTFELPICTIFTIENGKITKDFSYFDNFEEGDV